MSGCGQAYPEHIATRGRKCQGKPWIYRPLCECCFIPTNHLHNSSMLQTTRENGVSNIQTKGKALACLVWTRDNKHRKLN